MTDWPKALGVYGKKLNIWKSKINSERKIL